MENKAKMPCKRLDSRSMWIWLDILRVVQAIARFIHRSAIRQIANLRSRSTAKPFPGYQQIQTDPFHSQHRDLVAKKEICIDVLLHRVGKAYRMAFACWRCLKTRHKCQSSSAERELNKRELFALHK